jgi:capsular exopolysaccharide synthesis family protein
VKLQGKKEEIEDRIQELLLKYKEKHPEILRLKKQIEIIETKTREAKAGPEDAEDKILEYNLLKGQVGAYRKLYDRFSMASEEADVTKGLILSGIQVIDKARVPSNPLPPPKGIGGWIIRIGILLGVVLCFLVEYLDNTLKTAEEVEFYAKMPFLGYIPSAGEEAVKEKELILFSHLKPDSRIAEAFRNIKVALIFAAPEERPLNTLMITSSIHGEGRTFIASNLATTFAHADESTLLIDADMRKGALGEIFGIKTDKGLSSFLSGKSAPDELIVSTSITNLSILPSGPHVFNPTDLLKAEKLEELMKAVKSRFQRIIIDIPSVLSFADVLLWEKRCDGLMHVIKAGRTPVKEITEAKKKLEGKIEIIGAILNNAEIEKRDLYYYYHYFQSFLERELEKIKEATKEIK